MIDKLPEIVERKFALKYLKEIGYGLLIASVLILVIAIYMEIDPVKMPQKQFRNVEANHIKKNTKYFHYYLDQIKANNGTLLLGTSETVWMDGVNYWRVLDGDSSIQENISVLSGAGRCMDIYYPLIVANPEAWKDLELMVFVNPTYWREGLNYARETYMNRYLDKGFLYSIKGELQEKGVWDWYSHIYKNQIVACSKSVGYEVDVIRSVYYYDFKMREGVVEFPFDGNFHDPYDFSKLSEYRSLIDTTKNVSYHFLETTKDNDFPSVDTASSYRSEMLSKFIRICDETGVNLTIILGPYNAFYADAIGQGEKKQAYEDLHLQITDTLNKYQVNTIDLWDLSYRNDVFKDYQHHGKYGAYLIYKQLKPYFNENR